MDMDRVNKLDFSDFTDVFVNVIEHCQVLSAAVWSLRPFANVRALHEAYCKVIDALQFEVKEGILRCHPDLAGRMAAAGGLTSESTREQSSAGLLQLSPTEADTMSSLNAAYTRKFNFPFVICVRHNKKAAIMAGLEARLEHSRETEVLAGIEEVKKIGHLRLCDLVDPKSEAKL